MKGNIHHKQRNKYDLQQLDKVLRNSMGKTESTLSINITDLPKTETKKLTLKAKIYDQLIGNRCENHSLPI